MIASTALIVAIAMYARHLNSLVSIGTIKNSSLTCTTYQCICLEWRRSSRVEANAAKVHLRKYHAFDGGISSLLTSLLILLRYIYIASAQARYSLGLVGLGWLLQ